MSKETKLINQHLPHTEEQIRAHTIGDLQPLSGKILIKEYDPQWPILFKREADRVCGVLADRVLRIEHIGSTSVPDLPAKPLIDMLLVVSNSADEDSYAPDLARAGYTLRIREPDWHEHRMFKGPDTDVNLHVFSSGCPEIANILSFRDWLRGNAADRDLYMHTKRALAQKQWKYIQNYADAKSNIVQEILTRARLAGK